MSKLILALFLFCIVAVVLGGITLGIERLFYKRYTVDEKGFPEYVYAIVVILGYCLLIGMMN